jgi:chondroitin-sulfate-ABC endolyase/exolyase
MRLFFSLLLSLLPPVVAFGQAWELFESESVPPGWTLSGGNIQASATRSIQGDRSLEWSWTQPATTLTWDLPSLTSGSGHRVFSQWIRLEEPLPATRLRVELRSTSGGTRFFEMNLDFTGWRTVFVPYSSMEGSGTNSIDRVRWTLVGQPPVSGTLFVDQVIVGQAMDVRFQYADVQAPFVWEGREKSMWENRAEWNRRQPPAITATAEEILAARRLRESWDARLTGTGSVTTSAINQWESRLNAFRVRRENGRIRGNQIFYRQYPDYAYPPALAAEMTSQGPNDFQEFTTLMLDIARAWHRTTDPSQRERLETMLILMGEHLLDQGWAAGSNQGCLFLLGYQSREYMRALYLAREVFGAAGMIGEAGEAARWFGQAGSLLEERRAPNMDFFNTLAQGQLLSLLMEPDENLQVAWLRAFSRSISQQIAETTPGDANGFKPDGTAFHHNGHYPAYAIGGISTLGQIFDVLRETPFTPEDAARMSFRRVLLAARAYSQLLDWPIGISGRHPFSGSIGAANGAFAALAQYPDPISGTPPDREIAAAYVRLWGQPGGDLGSLFNSAGIQAENPAGFHTFPFANHAVYRSGNWMVSLKGYSRYVWSSEIYAADNRYGRYQSNGTAEILLASGRAASGFREEGWDWNRLPGTTAVHLPLDQLESPNAGTLMLRSNETFAGGVSAGLNGAFGFILNENRFGHTLRARKSVFAANGMLILLGSQIQSDHTTAPVVTSLFQVALDASRAPITLSSAANSPISSFPWTWNDTLSEPFWAIDAVGNGFWLPPGQQLRFSRVTQQSRHNKTKAVTSGDFASGWLDHGSSPHNGSYQYVILPQASAAQMNHFHNRMASSTPAYEVLRQTNALHAVRLASPERYGFSIFEAGEWNDLPHLLAVDAPALLWMEETPAGLLLAVANPDLNPGETENLVSPTSLSLRGHWSFAAPAPAGVLLWHEDGQTRIAVPAKEGRSYRIPLAPASTATGWPQSSTGEGPDTVSQFRSAAPSGPFFTWDRVEDPIFGYIIERMLPDEGHFHPVGFVNRDASTFFDRELSGESLAYYRMRTWGEAGTGAATHAVLIYDAGSDNVAYDFRTLADLQELQNDGWTSSGLQSASDWYQTSQGMFLIDNSTTLPASLTIPIARRGAGKVTARMGVARTANFNARIELLAGSASLGMIQLTTRTAGFLRGPDDLEFTDDRWDIEQGTLRNVSIEWRELPGVGLMEIILRYDGTSDDASAKLRWEIPAAPANQPDRIRLSVGFNSAVNRGLVLESLEISTAASYSLGAFYRAWAETFLADRDAEPADDATGEGLANLWQFVLAKHLTGPTGPTGRQSLTPQLEATGGMARFVWDLPKVAGATLHLEATEQLNESWGILPHSEEPLSGFPGWVRLLAPPWGPDSRQLFYRIVLSANLD